jgi:DNA-binding transcriptional LysR family regulator
VVGAGASEDPVDRWLTSQGRSRRIVTVVSTYLLALHLVSRSGVHAILPSRLVAELGSTFGLKATKLAIPQPSDQIFLLHPRVDEADPGARWFREFVRSVCLDPSRPSATPRRPRTAPRRP